MNINIRNANINDARQLLKIYKPYVLGKMFYTELERRLKEQKILNVYACIAYPERDDEYLDKNSAQFHKHLGYRRVGTFRKCDYKFGRWYNMVWYEKFIGKHK